MFMRCSSRPAVNEPIAEVVGLSWLCVVDAGEKDASEFGNAAGDVAILLLVGLVWAVYGAREYGCVRGGVARDEKPVAIRACAAFTPKSSLVLPVGHC